MAKDSCKVCGSLCEVEVNYNKDSAFRVCPVCGRYEITLDSPHIMEDPRLASYLFYNRFEDNGVYENRYHTTLSKETCDIYRKELEAGNNTHGHPVHVDEEIIASWYPKTFSERIDRITCKLHELTSHIGQEIQLDYETVLSLLFVDRLERGSIGQASVPRQEDDCIAEAQYMIKVLVEKQLVSAQEGVFETSQRLFIMLNPEGYDRVDQLQKNNTYGNSALVAMKFGDETLLLREAIRKGITASGYTAVFIDEVQHNDFITPELLKHIRDSKFVVVDLTHQNNGAYFEEGYAMGLGKPVIQLCQKDTKLHFDIAQKNTIIWEKEDEIPTRLENRIRATID